ncbi:MAG TPA: hypothetical protein VMK31_02420 [Sphingomicrobium sp.]|nr:hypothetical protein [Sphingomicrobium sp.]
MKRALAIVAATVLAVSPAPAAAQAASFMLVNNTDIPLTAIEARRFGTQQWRQVVVAPTPVAASGGQGTADFSDEECAFDLQATLPDGRRVVWRAVNLCEARVVTLNRTADGQLWVDYR